MKYINFKIDSNTIKENKVVKGIFLRGQKNIDYNWELIGEFKTIEDAVEYVKSIVENVNTQRLYGLGGYGIKLS